MELMWLSLMVRQAPLEYGALPSGGKGFEKTYGDNDICCSAHRQNWKSAGTM